MTEARTCGGGRRKCLRAELLYLCLPSDGLGVDIGMSLGSEHMVSIPFFFFFQVLASMRSAWAPGWQ